MLPEKLREYFSFSKKERIGIVVLIAFITIIFILPHFFSAPKSSSDRKQFEQFKNEIAQLKLQKDSVHNYPKNYEQDDGANEEYHKSSHINSNKPATLFYFDPNTATDDEWKKLGLQDRTIRTLTHYLSKGGKFRKG
jgi:competence protein ComEA